MRAFGLAEIQVSRERPAKRQKSWSSSQLPSHQRKISRAIRFSPGLTRRVMSKLASSLLSSL